MQWNGPVIVPFTIGLKLEEAEFDSAAVADNAKAN